jgi:hypothetical protein
VYGEIQRKTHPGFDSVVNVFEEEFLIRRSFDCIAVAKYEHIVNKESNFESLNANRMRVEYG